MTDSHKELTEAASDYCDHAEHGDCTSRSGQAEIARKFARLRRAIESTKAALDRASRTAYGLPTKPVDGYCGLAGKPYD